MRAVSGTPHKRRRRTREQIAALERQILEVLEHDHPQSIRHVFYRMTDPRLSESVEKTERGYEQLQRRLTSMRRRGVIPYGWITDATRRGYHVATFAGADDFLRSMVGLYRASPWRDSGVYVEVWVESRSIAGVVLDDCEELAVSLYPAGGFTNISLAHQAAEHINADTVHGERPAHVIYIGDRDPSGVCIDPAIERELRKHLDPNVSLEFHRIAITAEQVERLDLPTKPRKSGDRRAPHITETVEAEAMPAHLLRQLLRESVERFLPPRALQVARVAEESERQWLEAMAEIRGGAA